MSSSRSLCLWCENWLLSTPRMIFILLYFHILVPQSRISLFCQRKTAALLDRRKDLNYMILLQRSRTMAEMGHSCSAGRYLCNSPHWCFSSVATEMLIQLWFNTKVCSNISIYFNWNLFMTSPNVNMRLTFELILQFKTNSIVKHFTGQLYSQTAFKLK